MAVEIKESESEHWMNSKWRPAMGWMYMLVCIMDMVIFPVLWSVLQATVHGSVNTQWQPLTLQGAGLFHLAMGAVLGIAAFGRTQEKLNGANNGGAGVSSTYTQPVFQQQYQPAFQQQQYQPAFQQPQIIMINGKAAPPPAPQPEI